MAQFELEITTPEKRFFDEHRQVVSGFSFRHFIQIHEHGYKRRLSVTGHQSDQLILDGLYPALNFLSQTAFHDLGNNIKIHIFAEGFSLFDDRLADLFSAHIHERCQVR